jgi:hypothetical protein
MLRAPLDGDLMDPATWQKTGYPVLDSEDFDYQQRGPGHNSFTLDADGNPVIVYHARPPESEWLPGADGGLNDPSRHARVKTVHFAVDGSAVLNQTREEELAPENQTVTLTVTVTGDPLPPALDVTATTTDRCVVGKATQVVTVTNNEQVPVEVTVTSPYGTKTVTIAAGKSKSVSFSTRAASIEAGTITLSATATIDGTTVTADQDITYEAAAC